MFAAKADAMATFVYVCVCVYVNVCVYIFTAPSHLIGLVERFSDIKVRFAAKPGQS